MKLTLTLVLSILLIVACENKTPNTETQNVSRYVYGQVINNPDSPNQLGLIKSYSSNFDYLVNFEYNDSILLFDKIKYQVNLTDKIPYAINLVKLADTTDLPNYKNNNRLLDSLKLVSGENFHFMNYYTNHKRGHIIKGNGGTQEYLDKDFVLGMFIETKPTGIKDTTNCWIPTDGINNTTVYAEFYSDQRGIFKEVTLAGISKYLIWNYSAIHDSLHIHN